LKLYLRKEKEEENPMILMRENDYLFMRIEDAMNGNGEEEG